MRVFVYHKPSPHTLHQAVKDAIMEKEGMLYLQALELQSPDDDPFMSGTSPALELSYPPSQTLLENSR